MATANIVVTVGDTRLEMDVLEAQELFFKLGALLGLSAKEEPPQPPPSFYPQHYRPKWGPEQHPVSDWKTLDSLDSWTLQ